MCDENLCSTHENTKKQEALQSRAAVGMGIPVGIPMGVGMGWVWG